MPPLTEAPSSIFTARGSLPAFGWKFVAGTSWRSGPIARDEEARHGHEIHDSKDYEEGAGQDAEDKHIGRGSHRLGRKRDPTRGRQGDRSDAARDHRR